MVKNPPVMQETQVWSLGQNVPLEKEKEAHSSILALPRTQEPGQLQSMALQRLGHNEATNIIWVLFKYKTVKKQWNE